jgi:hypothetical protein
MSMSLRAGTHLCVCLVAVTKLISLPSNGIRIKCYGFERPMNSCEYFASQALVQFMWWPLFFFTWHSPMSWFVGLWLRPCACLSETYCLHFGPKWLTCFLSVILLQGRRDPHFPHWRGAWLCKLARMSLLMSRVVAQRRLEQWYSTWGTRRHLRGYVKLKKANILFHDKHIN